MRSARASERGWIEAPDGSMVDVLLAGERGSMARFVLPAGAVSRAVVHRSVEELWFVLSGEGEMWRGGDGEEAVLELRPGTALQITAGTRFQFRAAAGAPLVALGVTMPPWPGEGEATVTAGPWEPGPERGGGAGSG